MTGGQGTDRGPQLDAGDIDADDIDALMHLAEEAARSAGELVRQGEADRVGGRPSVASTKSSPTDVVTAMDRAVERHLRERLAAARPDDGLLGEEEDGLRAGTTGLTWVLDPIDGTVNYLYRIPHYAVSVAVVTGDPRVPGGWQPVAGCVHQAVTGQTWTAGRGRGATEDGVPLRLRSAPDLSQALVATGFGYRAERRRSQARVVAQILPLVRDVRRIGSSALDLCSVASGRVDLYYERGLNVWDLAAAVLVVTEAGGVVTGLQGRPIGDRTLLAGDAALCQALGRLLLDAGADADEEPA